jgi:hypothetical protein
MLQRLKVTSYALLILLLLVLPSQAVAQCLTQDECAAAAEAQGLKLGGAGYGLAGPYRTKGCYSYESGKYQGMAYFGTGGSPAQMEAAPAAPKYRILCGSKKSVAPTKAIPTMIKSMCNVAIAVCKSSNMSSDCIGYVALTNAQCKNHCLTPQAQGSVLEYSNNCPKRNRCVRRGWSNKQWQC